MASPPEKISMALFCDFENVALGVRDANYDKFDIKPVLERLLLKGSIVVKKAYCDWDRYKGFKAAMHEANFELIEIPHVRQSGKNSADIRLVVDALDLCYTKSHVNTFVIISGDSDFSPLVSKLRENAKHVIGVGVKQSTSDLLVANCDDFIFYDDLVRDSMRASAKRETRETQPAAKRSPDEEKRRKQELDARKSKGVEIAVQTFDALQSERGDSGKIWASVLKEAIKRRKPDFNESYYGFRAFGNLLEDAQARGLLEFGRDERSGAYVYRSNNGERPAQAINETAHDTSSDTAREPLDDSAPRHGELEAQAPQENARRTRGGRKPAAARKPRGAQTEADLQHSAAGQNQAAPQGSLPLHAPAHVSAPIQAAPAPEAAPTMPAAQPPQAMQAEPAAHAAPLPAGETPKRRAANPRRQGARSARQAAPALAAPNESHDAPAPVASPAAPVAERPAAPRSRRPRKSAAPKDTGAQD